jgi:hypothetical protein
MNIYIYGLICPISKQIKYVGQSINPTGRLKHHKKKIKRKDKKLTYRDNWINFLHDKNLIEELSFVILEKCDEINVNEKEIYYINLFKNQITNIAEGGYGGRTWMFSESGLHPNLGKKRTSEQLKKMSEIQTELMKDLNRRKQISDKQSPFKLLAIDYLTFEILYEFRNCKEASDQLGYTYSNIKNARRDKRIIGKRLKNNLSKMYVVYENEYEDFKK